MNLTLAHSVIASAFRVFAVTAQADETPPPPPAPPAAPATEPTHDEKKEEKAEAKEEKKEGEGGEKKEGEKKEGEGAEEEEEDGPKWNANADFVLGFGTTDVLVPGSSNPAGGPTNQIESARVRTYSFIVGLERKLGRFDVGVRMPFLGGNITTRDIPVPKQDFAVAGNLEIEGAYAIIEGKSFDLDVGIELALPTGGGTEQPLKSEVAKDPEKKYEYDSIARGQIMKVAEWSRGSYESALFEPDRFGIIPRVAARFRLGPLTIRPAVKVENLVDVKGDAPEPDITEVVASVRASVAAGKYIEPGVMAWTNITATKHEERDLDIIELYPYVRAKIGPIQPEIGAYLPVFGHLAFSEEAKSWGLKLAINARF